MLRKYFAYPIVLFACMSFANFLPPEQHFKKIIYPAVPPGEFLETFLIPYESFFGVSTKNEIYIYSIETLSLARIIYLHYEDNWPSKRRISVITFPGEDILLDILQASNGIFLLSLKNWKTGQTLKSVELTKLGNIDQAIRVGENIVLLLEKSKRKIWSFLFIKNPLDIKASEVLFMPSTPVSLSSFHDLNIFFINLGTGILVYSISIESNGVITFDYQPYYSIKTGHTYVSLKYQYRSNNVLLEAKTATPGNSIFILYDIKLEKIVAKTSEITSHLEYDVSEEGSLILRFSDSYTFSVIDKEKAGYVKKVQRYRCASFLSVKFITNDKSILEICDNYLTVYNYFASYDKNNKIVSRPAVTNLLYTSSQVPKLAFSRIDKVIVFITFDGERLQDPFTTESDVMTLLNMGDRFIALTAPNKYYLFNWAVIDLNTLSVRIGGLTVTHAWELNSNAFLFFVVGGNGPFSLELPNNIIDLDLAGAERIPNMIKLADETIYATSDSPSKKMLKYVNLICPPQTLTLNLDTLAILKPLYAFNSNKDMLFLGADPSRPCGLIDLKTLAMAYKFPISEGGPCSPVDGTDYVIVRERHILRLINIKDTSTTVKSFAFYQNVKLKALKTADGSIIAFLYGTGVVVYQLNEDCPYDPSKLTLFIPPDTAASSFKLSLCIPKCQTGEYLKNEFSMECVKSCQPTESIISLEIYGGLKACKIKCPLNCLKCNNEGICFKCNSNHYLVPFNKGCTSACKSEELVSFSSTDGYGICNSFCKSVISECKECIVAAKTTCSTCETGYYLFSSKSDSLFDDCVKCDFNTLILDKYSNKCRKCSEIYNNCKICSLSSCIECTDGFFLVLPKPSSDSTDLCSDCLLDTSFKDTNEYGVKLCKSCRMIHQKCTSCVLNNCTSCETNYYLFDAESDLKYEGCTLCSEPNAFKVGKVCKMCTQIFMNCLNCANDFGSCLKCDPGFTLAKVTNQLAIESTGCKACGVVFTGCQECSQDSVACKKCGLDANGCHLYLFQKGGNFLCTDCLDETMIIQGENCLPCTNFIAGCEKCIGNPPTCILCQTNLYLEGKLCVSCHVDWMYKVGILCKRCSDTIANCQSCVMMESKLVCKTCSSGFYLFDEDNDGEFESCQCCLEPGRAFKVSQQGVTVCQTCSQAIQNCVICAEDLNSCKTCRNNFFVRNGLCIECKDLVSGCKVCSPDGVSCAECGDESKIILPFLLDNGTCSLCDSAGFYRDSKLIFENSTERSLKTCVKCTQGCTNCEQSGCLACAQGFYLKKSVDPKTCEICKPENCKLCDESTCIECQKDYFQKNLTCLDCKSIIKGCKKCSSDGNRCLECIYDESNQALLYYLLDNGTCSACKSIGFFRNSKIIAGTNVKFCNECPEKCLDCDIQGCLACIDGYYLIITEQSKTCEKCTLKHCKKCETDKFCAECQAGFKLLDGQCNNSSSMSNNDSSGHTSSSEVLEQLSAYIFLYSEDFTQRIVFYFKPDLNSSTYEDIVANLEISPGDQNGVEITLFPKFLEDSMITYNISSKTSHPSFVCDITIKNISKIRSKKNQGLTIVNDVVLNPNVYNSHTVHLKIPKFLSKEQEKSSASEGVAKVAALAISTAVSASILTFLISPDMQNIWYLLNSMQISSFLLMINVDYPHNLKKLLIIMLNSHLSFLPDYLAHIFNLSPSVVKQGIKITKPGYKAPAAFERAGLSLSIFENAGVQIQIIISYLIIRLLFDAFAHVILKKRGNGKMQALVQKLCNLVRFTCFITINNMVFLKLVLSSWLQLRLFGFQTSYLISENILAIASLLYMFSFLFWIFRRLQNPNTFFYEQNHMTKYGSLFSDIDVTSFFNRNIRLFLLTQKLFMCGIMVLFHDLPYLTLSLLSAMELGILLLVLFLKPYQIQAVNLTKIFESILYLTIFGLIIYINYHVERSFIKVNRITPSDEDTYINIGWALIALVILILFLYFVNHLIATYKIVNTHKHHFKKFIFDRIFITPDIEISKNSAKDPSSISDKYVADLVKTVKVVTNDAFSVNYKHGNVFLEFSDRASGEDGDVARPLKEKNV